MLRRIACVTGAAIASLALLGVPTAQADDGVETTDGAGSAWFQSYGEHLTVNDWAADGHGVRVRIQEITEDNAIVDISYNTDGYDAPAKHFNLSLPDGMLYDMEVCLVDRDMMPKKCAWETITA